jgi:hypothetical protein
MNELELIPETEEINLESFTDEELILVASKELGYENPPVHINQFMEDPYYLGNLSGGNKFYPFWKEKLRLIYPDPIRTRYPIIVFRGAIGTGKSTAVRVMAMYQLHRILSLINPHETFGLMPGKNLKFSFFSASAGLAQTDFVDVIWDWIDASPYFSELRDQGKFDQIEIVADGVRTNKNIGSDVIFYNLSELNFVNPDKAYEKLNSAKDRWKSRFLGIRNYFGHLIIDTSAKDTDSIADEFVNNNTEEDLTLVVNTCQWVAKAHTGDYGNHGWFKVYAGDSTHRPFIVDDMHPITLDLDEDRIIDVPEEVRSEFEGDIELALQDLAGISTNSSDKFFPDTTKLCQCFNLPMHSEDVIRIDFYDKTDKLIYKLDSYLREIPDDKIIYVHYDIGVTGDNTGLAIAYFDKWHYFDKVDGTKFKLPEIIVPMAVGLNRYEEQETPIYQLEEFIYDLDRRFEIGCFSADQFASRQLLQDLTLNKIPNRYLSVDRSDVPYKFVKSQANFGLLRFPMNKLLKFEMCDLRRVGNKIDHPANGSKDLSDGACGAIYSVYEDIEHASQLSNKYKAQKINEVVLSRQNTSVNELQGMLHGIFG